VGLLRSVVCGGKVYVHPVFLVAFHGQLTRKCLYTSIYIWKSTVLVRLITSFLELCQMSYCTRMYVCH
jgi:hypothetical protein